MNEPSCFEMSAKLRRTMSLCAPGNLLTFMEEGDLPAFREALKISDPNLWLEQQLASILDLACKRDRTGLFVRALLEANADVNKMNDVRKKAPVHFAAEFANEAALVVLLDHKADINLKDGNGNTVLHVLAKQPYSPDVETCIKLLLKNPELQTNKTNRQGKTAIYLAAKQGSKAKETVQILLESRRVNVDSDHTYDGETARNIILKDLPELELKRLMPDKGNGNVDDDPGTKLFFLLYQRNESDFVMTLEDLQRKGKIEEWINADDGYWTLLQYAIANELLVAAEELLEKGADGSLMGACKKQLPSNIAASGGYYHIVELLFDKKAKFSVKRGEKSFLHALIEGAEQSSSKDSYYRILDDIVPKLLETDRIDINATDEIGNSALHTAARYGDMHFVLELMRRGAYVGTLNRFGDPPLANISPEILEEFLNSCVTTNDRSPRDDRYEIIFNYKFLSPPVAFPDETDHSVSLPLEDSPTEPVPECGPLLYISKTPDLRRLLKHPVFTSFLALKWRGIRPFFYINLAFYLVFVALMTFYILILYEYSPETEVSPVDVQNTGGIHPEKDVAAVNKTNFTDSSSNVPTCVWSAGDGIWAILVIYFFCLIIRELFQLMVSPVHYLRSPENYLEILLIISSGLVLFYRCADATTRPHLSATTILLSWAELVLLIGRHPRLSTNIEMLKTVSMNFLQFLAWYSLLIIAFALSFYTLFRRSAEDDNFFLEPGTSFFKTVVMVTGEFDAGDLPFQYFPVTSHIVFVLFVFLVAIVLFNLLNGLAVSDTQAIKDDAELVGIVSRIKLVSYTESVLLGHPFWCRRKSEFECCCCQAFHCIRSFSFTRLPLLVQKVRLFPDIIPNKQIRVLPNDFSRISTDTPENERKSNRDGFCYNHCHYLRDYSLDSRIMSEAVNVLNQRAHPSEPERLQRLLRALEVLENNQESFILHSNKIRYLEEKVISIEKSCYKTQKAVEELLKAMQNTSENL